MRDWIDRWLGRQHDDVWSHLDHGWRGDLLGCLDKGVPAMLAEIKHNAPTCKHCGVSMD